MGLRIYKPTTPGRRKASVNLHTEVTKQKPEKSLLRPLPKHGGRNHQGKVTVHGRGGGSKRRYRLIDFRRTKDDMPATVVGIEYDPNRTCHIALLQYEDGTMDLLTSDNTTNEHSKCCQMTREISSRLCRIEFFQSTMYCNKSTTIITHFFLPEYNGVG